MEWNWSHRYDVKNFVMETMFQPPGSRKALPRNLTYQVQFQTKLQLRHSALVIHIQVPVSYDFDMPRNMVVNWCALARIVENFGNCWEQMFHPNGFQLRWNRGIKLFPWCRCKRMRQFQPSKSPGEKSLPIKIWAVPWHFLWPLLSA